jgi:putative phosphoesterase
LFFGTTFNQIYRMNIGVISDTHGLLRPEALTALRGSDHIVHAGDIGAAEILDVLSKLAPVTAIRGNIDVEKWSQCLPTTNVADIAGTLLYVLHDLKELDLNPRTAGFAAVISGHSHVPKIEWTDGVLYFNPGSAGPRRFKLPISVGRLRLKNGQLTPELIPLG